MLGKIKELMNVNDSIKEMSVKFDQFSEKVNGFSGDISLLKKEIEGLKESQNNLVEKSKADSESISQISEELRREVSDFKLMKSRLEKKLLESFENEIKSELMPKFEKLSDVVKRFENMEGKAEGITSKFNLVEEEIKRLIEVSKGIKKGDFELVRFANQLKGMDNEKLELMRKIDSLERLVSKMRRTTR